jgi:hypothetical protein
MKYKGLSFTRRTSPETVRVVPHPSKTAKGGAASEVMTQRTKDAKVGQPPLVGINLSDFSERIS